MMLFRDQVAEAFRKIQDTICVGLETEDGRSTFQEDQWLHTSGGGGRTRVIQRGSVFEKGGVNFSAVEGQLPSFMKGHVSSEATSYFATGVSIVLHPYNPHVPIIHMNIRYFESDAGDSWFGGGIDLTPIYVDDAEASAFHRTLKKCCDAFDLSYYNTFKKWADDYFFIPHRQETRGIGGIFFDYLKPGEKKEETLLQFVASVGNTFLAAYLPIVKANKSRPFTPEEKTFQLVRRGRYVEFNLVYDRGTRFGLETGGRIESILMSLPEHASWLYNFKPEENTPEAHTFSRLIKGVNWCDEA